MIGYFPLIFYSIILYRIIQFLKDQKWILLRRNYENVKFIWCTIFNNIHNMKRLKKRFVASDRCLSITFTNNPKSTPNCFQLRFFSILKKTLKHYLET